ncbi:MAG: transglycosylase SLT domain-containing protein [Bacteroidetes bacterium]|nr:transglycosylase SLT domain-containing protein [Bacteroidota bacterium]
MKLKSLFLPLFIISLSGCQSFNFWSPAKTDTNSADSLSVSHAGSESASDSLFSYRSQQEIDSLAARYQFYLGSQDTLSAVQTITSILDVLYSEMDSSLTDSGKVKQDITFYEGMMSQLDPDFFAATSMDAVPDEGEIDNLDFDRAALERVLSGLDTTGTQIHLEINTLVEKHIAYFQTKGKDYFAEYLRRAAIYYPVMLPILQEEGVPPELIYLTMVESGVNPLAKSRAKAIGIWQFIRGTGKLYDLRGNFWYDERRNIEKSTRAAARHFKDLYATFGDWQLALASYNSGAGRVRRAVKKSRGKTDFWEIRKYLPRETRNYVPAYIAATLIATNPTKFGFQPIAYQGSYRFDEVSVTGNLPLDLLAGLSDTTLETIQYLNPELTRTRTPPGKESYTLKIPRGKKESFLEGYNELADSVKNRPLTHFTLAGETVQGICKEYGVTVQMLAAENPKYGKLKTLPAGIELTIPVAEPAGGAMLYSDIAHYGQKGAGRMKGGVAIPGSGEKFTYKVKKGDTLGGIAQRFGVKTSSLKSWNGIHGSTIRAGQKLKIYKK